MLPVNQSRFAGFLLSDWLLFLILVNFYNNFGGKPIVRQMEPINQNLKLPFEERPSVFRTIIIVGIVSLAALELFMTAYDHAKQVQDLGVGDWLLFVAIAAVILFAGTARALIVVQTPHVRKIRNDHSDDSIRSLNRADAWMYFIACASAAYIGFLCYRVEALTVDLMVMMQIANVILLGLEWFYSQLTLARIAERIQDEEEERRVQAAQKEAQAAHEELDTTKELLNYHQNQNERLVAEVNERNDAMLEMQARLEGAQEVKEKLESLQKEQGKLLQIAPAAQAMQKLIGRGVFRGGGGSNQAVCPHCFELQTAGPASQSITCNSHGVIATKDQYGNWKLNSHDHLDRNNHAASNNSDLVPDLVG